MNSEWFILKKNEHLGPYSKSEILEMFDRNEIDSSVQIWREGWGKAKPFENAFAPYMDYSDSDVPPPVPLLCDDMEVVEKVVEQVELELKNETVLASNVVVDIPEESAGFIVKHKKKLLVGLISFCIIVLAVILLLPKLITPSIFSRPGHMSMGAYKRLLKVAKRDGKLQSSASLSVDKKTLWLSLNSALEGEVFVQLKSINGKTLGGDAQVKASGQLHDRLIKLANFQFISGSRLVEGIYAVEISSGENMELPWWNRFFGNQAKAFNFQGEVIVSSHSKKAFKKQLSKMLKRKRSNTQRFWEELIQKYQTVMMISDQIKEGFLKIFDSPVKDWKMKTAVFESEYKSKYGIFFTEFVKSNEASYKKIHSKKFENANEVMASYNHLSKLATEIGEHSMFILEGLNGFKGEEIEGDELKKKSLGKLDSIITRCRTKLSLLTESLK